MTNGNAATRRCEMASPVGLHVRFLVVKLLILKRVKISESTDMLREVTPVLRRDVDANNMSHIELA
jgi:hypothetical protein